ASKARAPPGSRPMLPSTRGVACACHIPCCQGQTEAQPPSDTILNEDPAAVQPIAYANRAVCSLAGRPLLPNGIRLLRPRIPEDLVAALAGILDPATDLQQRCRILRLDGAHRFDAKSLQGSGKSVKAPAVFLDERGDLGGL